MARHNSEIRQVIKKRYSLNKKLLICIVILQLMQLGFNTELIKCIKGLLGF